MIEKFVITSMVTQVVATASSIKVRSPYLYDIFVTCQQGTVNPGQYISAEITITNNGIYEGDVQVDWWIEDVYGVNYTSGSGLVNISSGETWISTKSLLVLSNTSEGTYYYKVRVSVGAYYSSAHDTFEVQRPTATTISAPSGGAAGVGVEVPEKKANMDVTYRRDPIVVVEIPKEYEIEIKNSGKLILHNLTLRLEGLISGWYSIIPEKVNQLEINKTIIFRVNYKIPESAKIKKYPVNILIKYEELEKEIFLTLNVIQILEETEFERKKQSIERNITEIEKELKELEEIEIPVDALEKLLNYAKEKLELAKIELEKGNFVKANELIYEAEILVNTIKEGISEIKPVRMRVFWSALLTITIVVVLSILSLTLAVTRKKYPRLPKIKKW